MNYSNEELQEAGRQLRSLRKKLEKACASLESGENAARCRSQITLARRRIRALEIAGALIEAALLTDSGCEE